MPAITKEQAIETLQRRPLYNRDFQVIKDSLNRQFRNAHEREVRAPFFHNGRYQTVPESVRELDYLDWSLHRVPGLIKKVAACKSNDPTLTAMTLLLRDWEDVAVLLAKTKTDVIKGRKPSATPRKTEPRTLDNTGTCPCCGHNVKLNGGRIVDHGFTLEFNQRNGKCFGVGYRPWEISPRGKVDLRAAVESTLEIRRAQYAKLLEDEAPKPGSKEASLLAKLAHNIRYDAKTVELLDEEINFWKATPLPGKRS